MTDIIKHLPADALELRQPEICGVVRADGTVIFIANVHPNPVEGFVMEPKAFLEEVEAGAIATWHTHPASDPNLSQEDMAGFLAWPKLKHFIIGIRDGEPHAAEYKVENGVVIRCG